MRARCTDVSLDVVVARGEGGRGRTSTSERASGTAPDPPCPRLLDRRESAMARMLFVGMAECRGTHSRTGRDEGRAGTKGSAVAQFGPPSRPARRKRTLITLSSNRHFCVRKAKAKKKRDGDASQSVCSSFETAVTHALVRARDPNAQALEVGRQSGSRNAPAPMVGSLFSAKSLLTNRMTRDDFPTAASPGVRKRKGQVGSGEGAQVGSVAKRGECKRGGRKKTDLGGRA